MREAFALQKLFTFFQQTNIGIFEKLTSKNLTKRLLTTSLVLNNWAQISSLPVFVCYTGFPSTINIIISGSNNVKK